MCICSRLTKLNYNDFYVTNCLDLAHRVCASLPLLLLIANVWLWIRWYLNVCVFKMYILCKLGRFLWHAYQIDSVCFDHLTDVQKRKKNGVDASMLLLLCNVVDSLHFHLVIAIITIAVSCENVGSCFVPHLIT